LSESNNEAQSSYFVCKDTSARGSGRHDDVDVREDPESGRMAFRVTGRVFENIAQSLAQTIVLVKIIR
jgi:hypothetical protein